VCPVKSKGDSWISAAADFIESRRDDYRCLRRSNSGATIGARAGSSGADQNNLRGFIPFPT
jgi:hypothetical protein